MTVRESPTSLQEAFLVNQQVLSTRRLPPPLLALLALSACGPDINLEAGETLHPTPENAPPADAALITTDNEPMGLSADALDQWRATGQGALISEDFPLIMRMTPEHFVAGWNDPYPRIEVHELDGS